MTTAAVGDTRREGRALSHDAWLEPDMRLISDDWTPAPALEGDALPTGWGAWITAEAAARSCPRDYVAAALITGASAWIGNARRIAATADWNEPANVWFALIGAPSTGKSPALLPMIETSHKLERDAEPAWHTALAAYERNAEAARAADAGWREDVRAAITDQKTVPDRPVAADAPNKPPMPRVIAMNTTIEKLQRLLAENERGLLHVRDELAGWFGGFDRYGGKGDDRAFFLETWNAGSYICDRVKDDAPVRIDHALVSVIGGLVPDRARDVLADADDGLAARFLLVWPDPVPIAPLNKCDATDAVKRRNLLNQAAGKLRSLKMGADKDGRPTPIAVQLDDDALRLFDEQRQDAMRRSRAASGLAGGWHGKNPGRVLRLALVFELLAWAARDGGLTEPASVSADAMARAGGFVDYAAASFERVTAGLAITQAQADAAQIARHVLAAIARAASRGAQLRRLNERTLYQAAGFSWARDAERRAEALAVMSEAAWLRRPQTDGHGRPRGDWEVSPRLMEAWREHVAQATKEAKP